MNQLIREAITWYNEDKFFNHKQIAGQKLCLI